jgi:CheY-like chemotaxis protein
MRATLAALLIVDDDPDVLDALCAVLSAVGFTVERATGGLAALDILDQQKPIDLLLTDVVMPGLHGFNLARMARLRRANLRVLYISGFTDLETILQDEGPRLGKLLTKPIAPSDLFREVTNALATSPPAPLPLEKFISRGIGGNR